MESNESENVASKEIDKILDEDIDMENNESEIVCTASSEQSEMPIDTETEINTENKIEKINDEEKSAKEEKEEMSDKSVNVNEIDNSTASDVKNEKEPEINDSLENVPCDKSTEMESEDKNEKSAVDDKEEKSSEVVENIETLSVSEDQKEEDKCNEKQPDVEEIENSEEKKVDTPEEIINLIKSLSPEKLKEIKKVIEKTEKKEEKTQENKEKIVQQQEDDEKMEVDEEEIPLPETSKTNQVNDDIICLDSDDDDDDNSCSNTVVSTTSETQQPNVGNSNNIEETIDLDEEAQHSAPKSVKRKASSVNGDTKRVLKECINPKCPRNPDDEYQESSLCILSMYHVIRKPNKDQWVCSTCFDNAFEIYGKLCSSILNNKPWVNVQIPKKQDLVEIIDSDEEENSNDGAVRVSKKKMISDSEKIIFNKEMEEEIEDILKNLTSKVDLNFQVESEQRQLELAMTKMDEELRKLDEEIKPLERKSYQMYNELYSINRPKFQRRPSFNCETFILPELGTTNEGGGRPAMRTRNMSNASISSNGTAPDVSITPVLSSPAIRTMNMIKSPATSTSSAEAHVNDKICYAIRQRGTPMPHWMPCKIVEDLSTPEEKKFKIQFNDNLPNSLTIVSGKEISYPVSSERLEIGARVIALFPRSTAKNKAHHIQNPQKRYLPGVIGEKLTQHNKRRYLVFCDYGQVKYCLPHEVREIQETSEFVWNDVHQNLRQFIKDYLESKTNRSRALLTVRVNTQIMTERAGQWRPSIVQEIDCSLVRIYFKQDHVNEWLYRGSKRLYAMFQQAQRSQSNLLQRRNDPGISYITIDDENKDEDDSGSGEVKRNIAKKSTSNKMTQSAQPPPQSSNEKIIILNDANIYLEDPDPKVSSVRHFTPKKEICAKKYVAHECSESCIPPLKNNLVSFAPLQKPLLTCWERQILRQKNSRFVMYKAPCGRRLRNYLEVFKFIGITKSFLNIENFDFEPSIQVLASVVVNQEKCGLFINDISGGKEGMKIQCINAFDDQRPPPLEYSPLRIAMSGVNINTDPEFMSCCDCTDECYDKSKCACFQMTIRGAKYKNLMEEDEEHISYVWKRLLRPVPTGIYECNSRCKCSKRCLNKVVQHPMQVKVQLYRTKNRGWGLQCLHDIPKGTFLCTYVGNLYCEKDANALCQGLEHGDEYFAELDLIETVEAQKEGYESGIVNPDVESDEEKDSDSDYDDVNESNDYDDGDFVAKTKSASNREIVTRSSRTTARGENSRKTSSSSTPQRTNSESSSDDEMVNLMPNTENSGALPEGMRLPFRKLYGPKEKVYIMDAKKCGNVGRYFNHSCDPNLFVQNVFVDTHDLRFPWIAFFSQRAIKAGEELTWNYNYEVGSVPSKVLYCHCGSKNCRGRIL